MADRVKNSIQQYSQNRYITGSKRVDVLAPPNQIESISHALGGEWKHINPITTSSFDSQIVLELQKSGYVGDVFLEFDLASPDAGTWTDYPALVAVNRITLLSQAGAEVHDFHLISALQHYMAQMKESERDTIRQLSGGVGFTSGRVCVPLPFFWTKISNGGKTTAPLASFLLNGRMRIELNMKTQADVLDAGATAATDRLNGVRLWYYHYQNDDSQRSAHQATRGSYKYKAHDVQTSINHAITASTDTTIDISAFHGSLSQLGVYPKSNKTTANNYFLVDDINNIEVHVDGDILYESNNTNALKMGSYLNNYYLVDPTFGEGLILNFGYPDPMNASRSFLGSYHLNDSNQFQLVDVNVPSTGVIDVVSLVDVEYTIGQSGEIKRQR